MSHKFSLCRSLSHGLRWIMMMCSSLILRIRFINSMVLTPISRKEPRLWKLFSCWRKSIMKANAMLQLLVRAQITCFRITCWKAYHVVLNTCSSSGYSDFVCDCNMYTTLQMMASWILSLTQVNFGFSLVVLLPLGRR